MSDTQTNPAARCPACLKTLDAATTWSSDTTPAPGDISVCAYCAAPLFFIDDLTVCALPAEGYALLTPKLRWQLDILRQVAVNRIKRNHEKD